MKLFLFDIDGVLIRPSVYFDSFLENRGYAGAAAALQAYYSSPEEHDCLQGKNDPLDILPPYLERFNWRGGTGLFLEQNYQYDQQHLDDDLLGKIALLRSTVGHCFLATDQNHRRKDFLLNDLDFRNQFDGWFISSELGQTKTQDAFWDQVLDCIQAKYAGIQPEDILFVDDRECNLLAAHKKGIETFHAKDEPAINSLKALLDEILVGA